MDLSGPLYLISADEIKKAQNLPTVTIGERILAEIHQTRQQIRDATQSIRQVLVTVMTVRYVLPFIY
jgi:hypothetical protein